MPKIGSAELGMLWALIINAGILVFCLWASKGKIRLFVAYFTVFASVNSLSLWYHVLPISAAMLKAGILLGLFLLTVGWVTVLSMPSHVGYLRKHHSYSLALMFGFLVVMLVGILHSADQAYGFGKTRAFAVFAIVPSLILVMLSPYTPRQLSIMGSIVILSSLIVAGGLLTGHGAVGIRATLDESINTNNVARNLGTGLLVGLMFLIYGVRDLSRSVLIVIAVVLMVLLGAILLTGSRGPLLSALATASMMFVLTFGLRRLIDFSRAGGMVLAAVVVVGVITTTAFGPVLKQVEFDQAKRVIVLTQRLGENRSDMRRLERYDVAIELFQKSHGLGVGTGGFYRAWQGPPLGPGVEDRDYPHNIFLEAASELGVVGLAILIGLMGLLFWNIVQFVYLRRVPDLNIAAFLGLWIYGILNAQVSGDIGTNYMVWLGMTLTLVSQAQSSMYLLPSSGILQPVRPS